jgi:hypothetical protein
MLLCRRDALLRSPNRAIMAEFKCNGKQSFKLRLHTPPSGDFSWRRDMSTRAICFPTEMHVQAGLICHDCLMVGCLVRRLTQRSAIVEVTSSRGIPNEVDLIIQKSSSVRHCRVIWRNRTRLRLELACVRPGTNAIPTHSGSLR